MEAIIAFVVELVLMTTVQVLSGGKIRGTP
jgi:hypothetical protein